MKLAKDKVFFKIRLAAFQASGGADTWHLKPNPDKPELTIQYSIENIQSFEDTDIVDWLISWLVKWL